MQDLLKLILVVPFRKDIMPRNSCTKLRSPETKEDFVDFYHCRDIEVEDGMIGN